MIRRRRPPAPRQEELPFLRRSRRLDRVFRTSIFVATTLALAAMAFGTAIGRRLAAKAPSAVRNGARALVGLGVDRAEFEAGRDRDRRLGVEAGRRSLAQVERDYGPKYREFLRAVGMGRDSAVVRWGNFDRVLALSSAVFEADDSGRSYRLRPDTRSLWLIGLSVRGVLAMFEIPDTAEARRLGREVGGRVVEGSLQVTNSWGCRGPEPDPAAPVRGIVLGDSNMQGLLVGDDETPPARLEARLRSELGRPVSILNTGHLGYSPEQYHHTLMAYYDRFRPQFVVMGLCANDFGDMGVEANWAETQYWLDATIQFCRARYVDVLAVPLPVEVKMLGNADANPYPGKLSGIFHASRISYLDPMEEFLTENLRLKAAALSEGRPFPYSPLFNGNYGDYHLSPLGCDLWARLVARRLRLIWAQDAPGATGPAPPPGRLPDANPSQPAS